MVLYMYIVNIDIAKRFREAAIIDKVGNIIVKRIRFANSHTGFSNSWKQSENLMHLPNLVWKR